MTPLQIRCIGSIACDYSNEDLSGAAQLRERNAARFQESNLHARLIKRIVMDQVVIDHEEVTRTFSEGTGKIELVAIYEVRDDRIATARFIYGPKTLDPKS
jgi:putative hydrolase of HD superfamily